MDATTGGYARFSIFKSNTTAVLANTKFNNCCFHGNGTTPTLGDTDIVSDPELADPANGDFSIPADSPAAAAATGYAYSMGSNEPDSSGAADFPDVGNVLESDTVNGVPGTYHPATVAEVASGVTFGPASAYTGTYTGDITPPGSGSITVTISGTTSTTTYAVPSDGDFASAHLLHTAPGAAQADVKTFTSGDLTKTQASLTAGRHYWQAYAIDTAGNYSVPSAIVSALVESNSTETGSATEGVENLRRLISRVPEWQNWARQAEDGALARIHLWASDDSAIDEKEGPFIVITEGEPQDVLVAQNTYLPQVTCKITFYAAREAHEDHNIDDQLRKFRNTCAQVVDGIKLLLGRPGYVMGQGLRQSGGPWIEKIGEADRRFSLEYEVTLGVTA
jgi:hypothetical protein